MTSDSGVLRTLKQARIDGLRHWQSPLSALLRLGGAAGKFALLLVMAKLMEPEALGVYGIFSATVMIGIYAVGLDYYTYTTRALLRPTASVPGTLIRDQVALQARSYAVVITVAALVFIFRLLPWSLAPWLVLVMAAEHLSLELYRLLVARKKAVEANLVFFVRAGLGSWVWALAALVVASVRSLTLLLALWFAGDLLAVVFGAAWNWDYLRAAWKSRPDWIRIRSALHTALTFLTATLAFRGILAVDRYALELISGTADAGTYTLYLGVANAILLVVESGVAIHKFPDLVEYFARGQLDTFKSSSFRFLVSVLIVTVAGSVALGLGFEKIVVAIGRTAYAAQIEAFWILLAAISFSAIGLVPHYVLFSMDGDREIMVSSVAALLVAVGGNIFLINRYGVLGAAIATLVSFTTMTTLKTAFAFRRFRVLSREQ